MLSRLMAAVPKEVRNVSVLPAAGDFADCSNHPQYDGAEREGQQREIMPQ
jgi:hypothetical protein